MSEKKRTFIDLATDTRIKYDDRRQLSFYFPINSTIPELKDFKPNNPDNLKLTYEGIYSITRPQQGAQFLRLFEKEYSSLFKKKTLVDGTAGLGGCLIYIGSMFKNCIAYEINTLHADAIRANTKEYNIDCKVVNSSIVDEYKNVLSDKTILWLDPPWGGPDKWKEENLKLYFYGNDPNNKNSEDLYVNDFIGKCFECGVEMVIMKCPITTFLEDLEGKYSLTKHKIQKYANNQNSGDMFQVVIIEKKKSGGNSRTKARESLLSNDASKLLKRSKSLKRSNSRKRSTSPKKGGAKKSEPRKKK